jgi:hypothetical protein
MTAAKQNGMSQSGGSVSFDMAQIEWLFGQGQTEFPIDPNIRSAKS